MEDKFNTAYGIRYGLLAGFFSLGLGFIYYLFSSAIFSSFWLPTLTGLGSLAVVILLATLGAITYRNQNQGVITLGQGIGTALMVFTTAAVFSIATQWIIPNLIDKQYPERTSALLKEKVGAQMEKWGAPDEAIEKAMKDMGPEKFNPDAAATAKNFGIMMIFYVIISVVIGAFVKRNSKDMIKVENAS